MSASSHEPRMSGSSVMILTFFFFFFLFFLIMFRTEAIFALAIALACCASRSLPRHTIARGFTPRTPAKGSTEESDLLEGTSDEAGESLAPLENNASLRGGRGKGGQTRSRILLTQFSFLFEIRQCVLNVKSKCCMR